MANMQATKTPMPEQDPNVRNKNFKEVTLGYTAEMAINEAKRCLQCKKPHCVERLPGQHPYPGVHRTKSPRATSKRLMRSSPTPMRCPRSPAVSVRRRRSASAKCVRGIKGEPVAIGRLERFVADWYRENIERHAEESRSPTASRSLSSAPARPA